VSLLIKLLKICFFTLLAGLSSSVVVAGENSSLRQAPQTLRVMSVVIVQQGGFLDELLAPYQAQTGVQIELSKGHHTQVAQAIAAGEVDLVITHSKVKALQKLETEGVLQPRQRLFANPVAFIGPEGDPADVASVADPLTAYDKIQATGHCFVLNRHHRMLALQEQWIAASAINSPCLLEADEEGFLKTASQQQAYTLWSLHPYARRPEGGLTPVVIGHKSLLENLSGWVVEGSPAEKEAQHLLTYLASETTQKRMTQFRLPGYPNQQAWWPAK